MKRSLQHTFHGFFAILFFLLVAVSLPSYSFAKNENAPGQQKKNEPEPEPQPEPEVESEPEVEPEPVVEETEKVTGKDKKNSSGNIVGDADATDPTKIYLANDYSLSGDTTIVGDVIIVAEGDFSIGNNTLSIADGATLTLYVKGDVTISGNGSFNNTNEPASLMIWGTSTTSQSLTLNGNGLLSAVVYAPNASLDSNGGGNSGALLGSVVAKTIRFNGSPGPFHFDEALSDMDTEMSDYRLQEYTFVYNRDDVIEDEIGSLSYDTYLNNLFGQL